MSKQDQQKISDAVAEAERATSGQIVPMIVSQSSLYPDARWRMGVALSFLIAFLLHYGEPDLSITWLLWAQVLALFIGYALGAFHPMVRPFLSRHEVLEEVKQRALVSFYKHGLSATRDRTGILIFVSLLERRVEIFADSGIHMKAEGDAWNQVVSELVSQIKTGRLTEGLSQAVTRCGDILKKHFPAGPQDLNELPNQLIIEH